jgi:hypothetical protein
MPRKIAQKKKSAIDASNLHSLLPNLRFQLEEGAADTPWYQQHYALRRLLARARLANGRAACAVRDHVLSALPSQAHAAAQAGCASHSGCSNRSLPRPTAFCIVAHEDCFLDL